MIKINKLVCVAIAVAASIAVAGSQPARAASTLVVTDSGNIGEFTFTNIGVVSGTADIRIAVPGTQAQINTVNGVTVPAEPVVVNTPLDLFVTPAGANAYTLAIIPNIATKTVGSTLGQQAILPFNLSTGGTLALLPNFFNASGLVTAVTANANPLYNFANFANGKGVINLTFTATTFTGTTSFAGLFATPGAVAVGNGSFSQQAVNAVPEPASLATLGLGLVLVGGLYYARRLD